MFVNPGSCFSKLEVVHEHEQRSTVSIASHFINLLELHNALSGDDSAFKLENPLSPLVMLKSCFQ